MERQLLKPYELSVNQNDPNSERIFKFWLRTVQDFIEGLTEIREDQPAINCKSIVIRCLFAEAFPFVKDCDTYEKIVATLRNIFFCGGSKHSRNLCPARNCTCYRCGNRRHFAKVYRKQAFSVRGISSAAALTTEKPIFVEDCLSSVLASAPSCLSPSIVKATLLGKEIETLVDSGASENFIDSKIASQLNLRVEGPSS